MTPREAIARVLWLRGQFRHPEVWPEAFAWHELEIAKPGRGQADDSAIGKCVRQAERVLAILDAAGLEATPKGTETQKGPSPP